jgi:hypothetical protein
MGFTIQTTAFWQNFNATCHSKPLANFFNQASKNRRGGNPEGFFSSSCTT